MKTVSPQSFPTGLAESLEEVFGESVPASFLLSGGLSGAHLYLVPFASAPYVVKVGPSRLIDRERINFANLNGTAVHYQVSCDPTFTDKIAKCCLPHDRRVIAYRFAGRIPAQTDDLLSFLECAEHFLCGRSEDFLNHLASIQQRLTELWLHSGQPDGEIVRLPDFLEPNWAKVNPILATAEAMSHGAVKRSEVNRTWQNWEEERGNPIRMRLGHIHGDLRCANIVLSRGEPYLVDFGSVRKAPPFIDLIRLEVDIVLRARIPAAIRNELLRSVFDPLLWEPYAAATSPAQRLIVEFRRAYVQILPGRKATISSQLDFYAAYMSELLRRTTYWEDLFLAVDTRQFIWLLLAQCVSYLHSANYANTIAENIHNLDRLFRPPLIPKGIGLIRCYYGGQDNDERNGRKHKLLNGYRGPAVLLAHSGFSYLVPSAPHFRAVRSFLASYPQNRFVAILTNPFCQAAIEIYLNWIRSYLKQNHKLKDGVRLEQNFKLTSSLQGYLNLKLHFGDQIEVRMTSFEPSCTVIWTSQGYFLEPYFKFDQFERAHNGLNTYEMECAPDADLADSFQFTGDEKITHLNFFYHHSLPFDKWKESRPLLHQAAESNLEWMERTGEIDAFERSCISELLQRYMREP